jgi:formate hydrogenlyase subunit 3/multisubunit Na+/H+ antiporter MnhD subunit
MSTDPRARRMASIGGLLLLGLACVLYVFIMNAIVGRSPSGGVPSGDSGARIATELDKLLPGFVIVLLWIMLAILLFLRGGGSQKMPPQALVAATILLPLSGVAAIYAANLYALYAGWAIVVPALLPPLIAFYAMWARLPALQAALPANITSAGAWARSWS